MEQYLRRGKLGSWLDDLGLRTVIAALSVLWFVWLWGLNMPSLLAGMALGLMGQMALTRYRLHTVDRREVALRRQLGGEMMLEELLLKPRRQAHLQAAVLLGQRYPLMVERVTEEGVLCRCGEEQLLVACLCKAPDSGLTQDEVLQGRRDCCKHKADRCVLCLTCKNPAEALAFAQGGTPPVRIISRETLLALAGQASPATDEQLINLGKRKKRPAQAGGILRMILHRDKAKRYMFYGTGMLLLYVLTGWRWYPLPGIALVSLGVWSRYLAREKERL